LSEREIIDFLSRGASYGLPGQTVERIETHCSVVFLVDELAYKLKRPIAFSALDYTSVARREAACHREFELNRRTAPELYRGIQAVRRRANGTLTFEDDGTVVDWVVVMRRFDQADLFDRLAATGRLTPELVAELAAEIARFHATAEPNLVHGGADGLRRAIEHNRADHATVAALLATKDTDALYRKSLAALDRLAPMLDRRRETGRVRVCHGDLRLANLCLYRGRPTLFDAIEFADELTCIDVLYDLAFLLMDLWHAGLRVEANLVFNRYLDATAEEEGLRALPLMVSIRAGTRAYAVAASSLRKPGPEERARLAAAAHDLMVMAGSLLDPGSPCLVAVGGSSERDRIAMAGVIAPALEPAPGARILCNVDLSRSSTAMLTEQIVSAGFTVLYACPLDTSVERAPVEAIAAVRHVPLIGLWLGDPQQTPPTWHAFDPGQEPQAVTAEFRRLLAAATSPRV
jgi:aminoglycoside phosphotransferase family enzyme